MIDALQQQVVCKLYSRYSSASESILQSFPNHVRTPGVDAEEDHLAGPAFAIIAGQKGLRHYMKLARLLELFHPRGAASSFNFCGRMARYAPLSSVPTKTAGPPLHTRLLWYERQLAREATKMASKRLMIGTLARFPQRSIRIAVRIAA